MSYIEKGVKRISEVYRKKKKEPSKNDDLMELRKEFTENERRRGERRLRETGVVALFEAIRDSGLVFYRVDNPGFVEKRKLLGGTKRIRVNEGKCYLAKVKIDGAHAELIFNHRELGESNWSENRISAGFIDDHLVIGGINKEEVGLDDDLVEVVGRAMIKPGYFEYAKLAK